MTKVYSIETTAYPTEARALYRAAEKVFELPPINIIVEALKGNEVPMKEYLTGFQEMRQRTPFWGPSVYRDMEDGSLLIITDGRRKIYVSPDSVEIDFQRNGDGSTVAAGEVIAHLREIAPNELHRIKVDSSLGYTNAQDYRGPVGKGLWKIHCFGTVDEKKKAGLI